MMPSWLDPWPDFAAVWAQVWREMRVAYVWPRHLTPHGRHGHRALGQPAPVPVIRSWLGSDPRPPHRSSDYRLDIP